MQQIHDSGRGLRSITSFKGSMTNYKVGTDAASKAEAAARSRSALKTLKYLTPYVRESPKRKLASNIPKDQDRGT